MIVSTAQGLPSNAGYSPTVAARSRALLAAARRSKRAPTLPRTGRAAPYYGDMISHLASMGPLEDPPHGRLSALSADAVDLVDLTRYGAKVHVVEKDHPQFVSIRVPDPLDDTYVRENRDQRLTWKRVLIGPGLDRLNFDEQISALRAMIQEGRVETYNELINGRQAVTDAISRLQETPHPTAAQTQVVEQAIAAVGLAEAPPYFPAFLDRQKSFEGENLKKWQTFAVVHRHLGKATAKRPMNIINVDNPDEPFATGEPLSATRDNARKLLQEGYVYCTQSGYYGWVPQAFMDTYEGRRMTETAQMALALASVNTSVMPGTPMSSASTIEFGTPS
jgi:hypothetical protein